MFSSSKLPDFRLYFFIVIYEVIGIGINSKFCEKWGNRDLRAGAKLYRPNLTAEDYSLPGCEGVIFIYWSAVHIDDFPIFTGINSSLHGFTMNQHNDKLPVGLLALLMVQGCLVSVNLFELCDYCHLSVKWIVSALWQPPETIRLEDLSLIYQIQLSKSNPIIFLQSLIYSYG